MLIIHCAKNFNKSTRRRARLFPVNGDRDFECMWEATEIPHALLLIEIPFSSATLPITSTRRPESRKLGRIAISIVQ